MSKQSQFSFLKLAASLLICFSASGLGAWVTSSSVRTWYLELARPSWNPPGWLFGPVWTLLFVMMGVSLWLVWMSPTRNRKAFVLFGIQLGLNVLWSCLFFGVRSPGLAFIEIFLLVSAILITFFAFLEVNKKAAWLLVPYLMWTLFATVLNGTIWWLNR